jgi:REP element-mobilizing transposase RayT
MYRRNLPHLQIDDLPLFVTFHTCNDFILPPEARDLAFQHCLYDHMRLLHMHSFVIMPTHAHLLFTPLKDEAGESFLLARIMNGIKGASSHSINKLLQRHGTLWQDESFDHAIRSDEEMNDTLFYILTNPLDAGLCRYPEEYPWLWRE